ncbi:hypothetical protein [Mesorhizobium sp. M0146]|uniref:hypothetical protein n=1 Tax=unclassified Mesorhizobium TaxID=325217 RepID=UPI00333C3D85
MTESRHDLYSGVEVVCIDDQVPLAGGTSVKDANITEGAVYRLRWVGVANLYFVGEYLGVKLEGVDSGFGEAWGVPDAPYSAKRFRPLVKDPIALFRKIAVDPEFKPSGDEGPLHPDGPLPDEPKRKVREEVD